MLICGPAVMAVPLYFTDSVTECAARTPSRRRGRRGNSPEAVPSAWLFVRIGVPAVPTLISAVQARAHDARCCPSGGAAGREAAVSRRRHLPHAVQLVSVPSWVLQPACGLPQLFQPAAQVGVHAPPVQDVAEVCAVPQVTPQPPQLVLSVLRLTSQPLLRSVSQLAWSTAQPSKAHVLFWQCPVALLK